jgi:PPOX class probable F420-dependent enzyme
MMDDERMRRLVQGARVARLASVDPTGRPHVVPIVFALEGDTVYHSVDAKPKRGPDLKRIRNIRENPAVEVVIDHYEDDWEEIWWVRLRGSGRIIERGPERDRALALLRDKYPQYQGQPPQGAVIAVDVETWRGWTYRPVQ